MSSDMRVGDLRHRVTLQYATRVTDGMGGNTVSWNTVAEVWAAVWPTSASSRLTAGQDASEITHRVHMRYRPDPRASWRLKFGDRYLTVLSIVNPNEKGTMLDLLCREAASA